MRPFETKDARWTAPSHHRCAFLGVPAVGARAELAGDSERRYKVFMKTLSLTEARRNLTRLARQAIRGEDVGLVCDGRVVALRAVQVYSDDYALLEYGLTEVELLRKTSQIRNEVHDARKKQTLRPWRSRKRP